MLILRILAGTLLLVAGLGASLPVLAQQDETIEMPITLGAQGRATILSPNLRSTELSIDSQTYRVLIPGCEPREPGVFYCESVYQYQRCRTLMYSDMVHSCRADLAFESGFAEPVAAAPGSYELEVDSDARVRIESGGRGMGNIRGSADVVLELSPPLEYADASCLLRDRYLYWATGPDGGMSDIADPDDCGEPIEFSFKPHDDDLLRAHDICETFLAWGEEIEDSIDVLVAGLFHVRSDDPGFLARHPDGTGVIALYVTVEAPLTIQCRE